MKNYNKNLFWILIIVAITLRIFLVAAIPTDTSIQFRLEGLNDEQSHFNYVKFLANNHKLPVQTMTVRDTLAFVINEFEYYQPPVYYLLCAPLISLAGTDTGLYLCRLISFLFGLGTLVTIAKILYRLDTHPRVILSAVIFAAFLPTHAYFSSVVSNDSLCWFLSTLLTLQLVNVAKSASREYPVYWRSALLIGIVLTAALLTKSSTLIFFPIVAAVFFWQGFRNRSIVLYAQGVVIIMMTLLLIAPWYIRNATIYGEFFALNMGFGNPLPALKTIWDIVPLTRMTIRYFWFPMQHLPTRVIPIIALEIFGIVSILTSACGFVWWLFKIRRFSLSFLVVLGALALSVLAYLKLHLSWSNSEARFLFTGFAGIIWVLIVPLSLLPSKINRYPLYLLWPVVLAGYPWLYLFFVTNS